MQFTATYLLETKTLGIVWDIFGLKEKRQAGEGRVNLRWWRHTLRRFPDVRRCWGVSCLVEHVLARHRLELSNSVAPVVADSVCPNRWVSLTNAPSRVIHLSWSVSSHSQAHNVWRANLARPISSANLDIANANLAMSKPKRFVFQVSSFHIHLSFTNIRPDFYTIKN